jgi:quinol monooxygenase YgiN
MIHVLATIELVAGKRDEFLRHFHDLVPQVRAEDGCLEYGPAVDVAADPPLERKPRAHTVVVIEKWRDLPALRAHLAAPHMANYRQQVAELVSSVELQILQPA